MVILTVDLDHLPRPRDLETVTQVRRSNVRGMESPGSEANSMPAHTHFELFGSSYKLQCPATVLAEASPPSSAVRYTVQSQTVRVIFSYRSLPYPQMF